MIERTVVYVDTSYLLASFYNSWEEGARGQLEISLANVVQTLNRYAKQQANQPVQRQFWYDGIPDTGPHRYQRTLRVIEGVQLRAGQLIEWGNRRTQKGVDTLLVADMVTAAHRGLCSDMVLVSGDADMIPGVRMAVEAGVRVHLIGFGWDSIASSLRHHCDTTTVLDPRIDFADSMQIRVLEGPLTPAPRTSPPAAPGHEEQQLDSDQDATMAEVDLRTERARATSVAADEAARSAEDEERAAAAEAGHDAAVAPLVDEAAEHSAQHAPFIDTESDTESSVEPSTDFPPTQSPEEDSGESFPSDEHDRSARPNPSMMAAHRKPLRSRYVPLSEEVWTSSGEATPFDVGQQYATWWYEEAASQEQRDGAHLLSGGALPPIVDRPLLQFACQVLNEFTLNEYQRVALRDGFHEGIRTVLLRHG